MDSPEPSDPMIQCADMVCLADSVPHKFLYESTSWQVVYAASPARMAYKKFVKYAPAAEIYKDCWTWEEIAAQW